MAPPAPLSILLQIRHKQHRKRCAITSEYVTVITFSFALAAAAAADTGADDYYKDEGITLNLYEITTELRKMGRRKSNERIMLLDSLMQPEFYPQLDSKC